MKKIIAKLSICLCILSLIACGGGSDNSGSCNLLNARIFGGETCNQDARSPVVLLRPVTIDGEVIESAGTCTATLVTVDDILTSAHCFTGPLSNAIRDKKKIAFLALVGGSKGEQIPIVEVAIHPNYDGNPGSRFDVAMATISKVPNPPIGPMPILVSEITLGGSNITAFGYGTNNFGETDELKSADFTITSLSEGNLIVVGNGEESICPGDSGGAAVYRTTQGVAAIAGVNSFGVGNLCQETAFETFGFVDLQYGPIINFIGNYAPDIALG